MFWELAMRRIARYLHFHNRRRRLVKSTKLAHTTHASWVFTMHIAFIFSREKITDRELRLVHAVRAMRGVSKVTVARVARSRGIAARFEEVRATAERIVGRQQMLLHGRSDFHPDIDTVELTGGIDEVVRSVRADRVVNLSGIAATPSPEKVILELRWNGQQPDGLGQQRAAGDPPREIVVICRGAVDQVRVVQKSVLTPTPATPAADRRNAASRSVALLLRALALSDVQLLNRAPNAAVDVPDQGVLARSANATLASVAVSTAAVVRRASRPLWRDDAWELRYRTTPTAFVANASTINANGFKTYRGDYSRFFADCIAFTHYGTVAVFFEEFPYALRRGVISCAVLQSDGKLGPPERVLERPYHLSYPFVFRDGEHVYMVPESSGNRTVDLYECTQFPHHWTFRQTLLENISATDATFYHDGTRWWMFATVGEQGAYGWDELHIFFADSLTSRWESHPNNPVKCDAKSARPAGAVFRKDGRLLRPTQDCSASYGGAVNLCEIEELSPTEFRERIVDRIDPALFPGMNGLHTLTASEGIEVVDVRPAKRWRWESGNVGTSAMHTE